MCIRDSLLGEPGHAAAAVPGRGAAQDLFPRGGVGKTIQRDGVLSRLFHDLADDMAVEFKIALDPLQKELPGQPQQAAGAEGRHVDDIPPRREHLKFAEEADRLVIEDRADAALGALQISLGAALQQQIDPAVFLPLPQDVLPGAKAHRGKAAGDGLRGAFYKVGQLFHEMCIRDRPRPGRPFWRPPGGRARPGCTPPPAAGAGSGGGWRRIFSPAAWPRQSRAGCGLSLIHILLISIGKERW